MRAHRKAGIVLGITLLLTAVGSGFGYMSGEMQKTVLPGDRAQFTVYLVAASGTALEAEPVNASGWNVAVTPRTVEFPVQDGRWVKTAAGYRRAAPLQVTVPVPVGTAPGRYPVTVDVAERRAATNGTTVAVAQRQRLRFIVDVPGTRRADASGSDNEEVQKQGTGNGTGMRIVANNTSSATPTGESSRRDLPSNLIPVFLVFELIWVGAVFYLLRN